jgi:hypothetical protein
LIVVVGAPTGTLRLGVGGPIVSPVGDGGARVVEQAACVPRRIALREAPALVDGHDHASCGGFGQRPGVGRREEREAQGGGDGA